VEEKLSGRSAPVPEIVRLFTKGACAAPAGIAATTAVEVLMPFVNAKLQLPCKAALSRIDLENMFGSATPPIKLMA
jgi:hypothetical protein